jgi:hypothetical protein
MLTTDDILTPRRYLTFLPHSFVFITTKVFRNYYFHCLFHLCTWEDEKERQCFTEASVEKISRKLP